MYSRCRLLSWLLCLIVISPAFTAETASDLLQQKALANIQAIDRTFDGVLGVYAIDLTDGSVLAYHADIVFPTASSIKVAILIELFRQRQSGKLRLEDPVTLAPSEKVGGSGHLQYQLEKGPVTLTVRELITAMIEDSDNTATNKVISMVGMGQVNTLLDNLELRKTRLQRIMLDGAAAKANRENISTPAELARLMEKIYREQVVDTRSLPRDDRHPENGRSRNAPRHSRVGRGRLQTRKHRRRPLRNRYRLPEKSPLRDSRDVQLRRQRRQPRRGRHPRGIHVL